MRGKVRREGEKRERVSKKRGREGGEKGETERRGREKGRWREGERGGRERERERESLPSLGPVWR